MYPLTLPASKSISNRALILAALGFEPVILENVLDSDDTRYLREVLSEMGIKFEIEVGLKEGGNFKRVVVTPPEALKVSGNKFFIGNAGTAARFVSALSLILEGDFELSGIGRMHERPFEDLFKALNDLGVGIEYLEKPFHLPARFKGLGGKLKQNEVTISGKISSQFISGLLLVAPRIKGGLEINIKDTIPSLPYIEMTLEMLRIWGVKFEVVGNYKSIKIEEGIHAPKSYLIPADMTAASIPMAWSVMTGIPLCLKNIGKKTLQGDEQFIGVIERAGGRIEYQGMDLIVHPPEGIIQNLGEIDFSAFPDTAMTGMVLGALAEGESVFKGLESLRVKECDRIEAMREGLEKLGIEVEIKGDEMRIDHKSPRAPLFDKSTPLTPSFVKEGGINSFHDHRIAFCFGILLYALGVRDIREIQKRIEHPECVAKTWPDFWLDFVSWSGGLREVSGVVIKDQGGRYLLVKKPRKDHAWQFPQGGVDVGETGLSAAKRELQEECGTDLSVKWVGDRPGAEYRYFFPQDFKRHEDSPVVGACVSFYAAEYIEGAPMVDGQEIVDYKWATREEIRALAGEDYFRAVEGML